MSWEFAVAQENGRHRAKVQLERVLGGYMSEHLMEAVVRME